jgi:hypothetical protein
LLPWHAIAQPPQLELSVVVSTHVPEQRVKPALQAVPQPLLVHVAVPFGTLGQTVPQSPQLLGSRLASTHPLPQRMKGKVHWKSHVPVQTGIAFGGALQCVPHWPQFEVSVNKLTHEPVQSVCVPHSVVQAPALQTMPASQAVAQLPQCLVSERRSTQDLSHTV